MNKVIADLPVRVDADIRPLLRNMDRAGGRVDRYGKQVVSANAKIVKAFKAAGAAAVVAVGSFAAVAKSAMSAAEELSDVSNKANTTVKSLQELRFAASQNGAATRDMDDALTRLTRRMSLFVQDGGGPAAKAIEALNLSVIDTQGNIRDSGEVFVEIAQKLSSLEGNARRAALASQLFGEDAGPRLVPLLSQGQQGIDEFARRAEEMGIILGSDNVNSAARANAEFRALGEAMRSQLTSAVLGASDAFIELAQFGTEVVIPAFAAVIETVAGFVRIAQQMAEAIARVLRLGDQAAAMQPSNRNQGTRNRRGAAAPSNVTTAGDTPSGERLGDFISTQQLKSGNTKTTIEPGLLPPVEDVPSAFSIDIPTPEEMERTLERIKEHEDKVTGIAKDGARERERLAEQEARSREGAQSDFWSNMAALGRAGSEKLFKVAKIAAIGKALLSMRETVTDAYAWGTKIGGPPLGALYASVAGAAQAANVAAIRSSSYGGGGGSGGGGAGGAAVAQAIPNYAFTVQQSFNGDFFTADQVASQTRATFQQLSDEVNRRGGSMDILFT